MTETTTETTVPDASPEDLTAMVSTAPVGDEEGGQEYLVRLLFRIAAKDPREAVEKYIDQLVQFGLKNWSFRVEDEQTGDMWHINGYGEELDSHQGEGD